MDYACPHCHELMRTDPGSGQPPPMCPRCGGDIAGNAAQTGAMLQPAIAAARTLRRPAPSLATFLQSTPPRAAAATDEVPGASEDAYGPGSQQAGTQAPRPTADTGEFANRDEGVDAEPGDSTHDLAPHTASTSPAVLEEIDIAGDARASDREVSTAADVVDSATHEESMTQADALAEAAGVVPASATGHQTSAAPSFMQSARDAGPPPAAARWQWVVLATLALALVMQVLIADRARLAADAQWRPLLISLCGVFGCSLPTWHEPHAFTMLSRDVRPVPGTSSALLVQATFRNDARWSQAWPVIRLSLSDADGRIVAARGFIPSEYLEATATQTVLAPGQSAQVMLQVREPEASVVAFSFDFD